MKLYANGCSFTHGHRYLKRQENVIISYGDYKRRTVQYRGVWPDHLSSKFDLVFNDACASTGGNRLVRSTLEFLSTVRDEVNDWIFVLQWSKPGRYEYYDSKTNLWINCFPEIDYPIDNIDAIEISAIANEDGMHPDTVTNEFGYNRSEELASSKFAATMQQAHWYYTPYVIHCYQQIKDIMFLQAILDQHNVKYIMTGMFDSCYDIECMLDNMPDHENTGLLETLLPLYSTSKFIDAFWFEYGGPPCNDPCGHPSVAGHSVVAQRIYNEIQKRGFIT